MSIYEYDSVIIEKIKQMKLEGMTYLKIGENLNLNKIYPKYARKREDPSWTTHGVYTFMKKYGFYCHKTIRKKTRLRDMKIYEYKPNKRSKLKIGMKFDKLLVTKIFRASSEYSHQTYAICKCDCGKNVTRVRTYFKKKDNLSCGCSNKKITSSKVRLPYGEAQFNRYLYSYKRAAKLRGIEWKLTDAEFRAFTKQYCTYCGSEPQLLREQPHTHGSYVCNGVDRVNNELGYELSNCVPACRTCNVMKTDMTYVEFIGHIQKIAKGIK